MNKIKDYIQEISRSSVQLNCEFQAMLSIKNFSSLLSQPLYTNRQGRSTMESLSSQKLLWDEFLHLREQKLSIQLIDLCRIITPLGYIKIFVVVFYPSFILKIEEHFYTLKDEINTLIVDGSVLWRPHDGIHQQLFPYACVEIHNIILEKDFMRVWLNGFEPFCN